MSDQFHPHDETQPVRPPQPREPHAGSPETGPIPPPPSQPSPPPAYPYPAPALPQVGAHPPENHLVWGILTTVLCCLPFGIVSIVKSSQVNTLWWQGRHAEAYAASQSAKNWAIASAATSAGLGALWLLVVVLGSAASTY